MKPSGTDISLRLRAAALVLLSSLFAHADDWEHARKGVAGLFGPLRDLLVIVLGIAALVALALTVWKMAAGEKEGAQRLAWWLAGLSVGFILMSLIPSS